MESCGLQEEEEVGGARGSRGTNASLSTGLFVLLSSEHYLIPWNEEKLGTLDI